MYTAVPPLWFFASRKAWPIDLCCTRARQQRIELRAAHACIGELYSCVYACVFAPLSSSMRTACKPSLRHAAYSGVAPSEAFTLMSHFASMSTRRQSTWLCFAASHSGVHPSLRGRSLYPSLSSTCELLCCKRSFSVAALFFV